MRFALLAFSAAALATLSGCSDPVPQVADGAFWLSTVQNDPTECGIAGNISQVGAVDASAKKTVIKNGQKIGDRTTEVTCTVSGTAAPFKVSGLINDQVNILSISIPAISPSNDLDSPADGSLTFSAAWTAGNPFGGNCKYYFEGSEGVASGRIWVSFQCDGLTSGMNTCPLKQGYAIFENCLTEEISDE